jgi:hypothetical protein
MNRFFLLAVFLLPLPLRAWDPYGHMMVTSVAYVRLNPAARQEVEKLAAQVGFPGVTYTPVTVGCWMDDIRTEDVKVPFQGKFKRWHYINWDLPGDDAKPPGPDPRDAEDTTDTKSGDVIQGLKRAIAVLKGGTDPSIPNPAIALALVCHLTGDIHQPLHTASFVVKAKNGKDSSDQGGNRVQIVNSPVSPGKTGPVHYNLHQYWDAAYRAGKDPDTGEVFLDAALNDYTKKDMEALKGLLVGLEAFAPDPKQVEEKDVEMWARESHELARDFVYAKLPERSYHMATRVEDDYTEKAVPLAKQRIVLAGYRLAALLNEVWKNPAESGSVTPTSLLPSSPSGTPNPTP